MKFNFIPVDRLQLAYTLCQNKRVMDVGGARMNPNSSHPFDKQYIKIQKSSAEYCIVDCNQTNSNIILDLNKIEDVLKLYIEIDKFKPDIILCMETLEHINQSGEVKNAIAYAVQKYGATAIITIPNNQSWVLFILSKFYGWINYHLCTFNRITAKNFILSSNLKNCQIYEFNVIGKYHWLWPLIYLISFCQGFSFGYLIKRKM